MTSVYHPSSRTSTALGAEFSIEPDFPLAGRQIDTLSKRDLLSVPKRLLVNNDDVEVIDVGNQLSKILFPRFHRCRRPPVRDEAPPVTGLRNNGNSIFVVLSQQGLIQLWLDLILPVTFADGDFGDCRVEKPVLAVTVCFLPIGISQSSK